MLASSCSLAQPPPLPAPHLSLLPSLADPAHLAQLVAHASGLARWEVPAYSPMAAVVF